MTSLLEVGLINAALATGLAIVVWLVTRVWRHPVFVHTLWIVVLLKLITPPVVSVPWRFSELKTSGQTAGAIPGDAAMLPADQLVAVSATNTVEQPIIEQPSITFAHIETAPNLLVEMEETSPLAATPNEGVRVPAKNQILHRAYLPLTWTTAVITIWLIGTMVYVFISALRLVRFHRALSHASPASGEIQRLATELVRRFGVPQRYQLRVTEGQLAPLVWPIGRPTILMPRRLLAALSAEEVETLLAHEFAHLSRRDHWLRWLELVVTAAYWWHPVVWWAKAAIGRAEEEACDAWVVSGFPDASARYASALFKAIQFASADRQAAPVVASALGGRDLKERIEHIMNATWKPRLFLPVRLLVLAAAMLILPLSLRAVGEDDEATQPVAPEATTTEAEIAAVETDAAATSTDAVDAAPAATESADTAISTEAAPDEIDPVLTGSEELAALREHVRFLEEHFKKADALFRSSARGGSASSHALSAYELAVAKGELALAEGNRDDAVRHLEAAEIWANEAFVATSGAHGVDMVTDDLLLQARNLFEIRRRLVQLRRPPQPAEPTQSRVPGSIAKKYPDFNIMTPAPGVTESMGVLKKIVQRAEQEYKRMKELAYSNAVSSSEVARAQSEYEISVERLKQAERALRFYRVQVEMAKAKFQALLDADKRAPGAVPSFDLRRAKLELEMAEAKLEELAQ